MCVTGTAQSSVTEPRRGWHPAATCHSITGWASPLAAVCRVLNWQERVKISCRDFREWLLKNKTRENSSNSGLLTEMCDITWPNSRSTEIHEGYRGIQSCLLPAFTSFLHKIIQGFAMLCHPGRGDTSPTAVECHQGMAGSKTSLRSPP